MITENEELLKQVEKLKNWKKGKAFIANKLSISEEEVGQLINELNGKSLKDNELDEDKLIEWCEERVREINEEKGTLKSSVVSDFEPKSIEELIELHKIDKELYKISSYWTKQRGDKFTSSLLCTLRKPQELDPERFAEFLKGYKSDFIPSTIITGESIKELADVEISLADFHIDKLDLNGETITDRKEQYKAVVKNLMNKVSGSHEVRKIVFTLGNDFYQTDTYNNTTTKGTPVDYSTPWNNAYEEGFDLMVWGISFLRAYCSEMEVILVAGNHDRTKSYYLAHALEIFFKNDKSISFKRDDSPTKHTMIGDTFVGYAHGDSKIDDLPLIFATSPNSSMDFGRAKYREIRTGDKHFYMTKEVKGVRIQQLPSLAGTDRWHRDSQYVNNLRAALALAYHPTKGKCGEWEERIQVK